MAAPQAGVAAGHTLTAEAALMALKDGGSAVDAAIAGLWAACIAEPVLASPGGGGFMMIGAGARTDCLDFFVQTPARRPAGPVDTRRINADFGTATQAFSIGAGAAAIPGMVQGLFAAHDRYGRLPMRALTEFAAATARDGITITPFQAQLFAIVAPILTATAEARHLFQQAETTLQAGAEFRNPALADALEEIASQGAVAVTEGEIAGLMLKAQEDGGTLSGRDLSSYAPQWRTPLEATVGAATVYLNPPPSAGGSLIGHMIGSNSRDASIPALATALDATDRAWTAADRSIDVFLKRHDKRHRQAPRGTTHISVIDREGLSVAATVSNGEGNGIIVPSCGFMINNMLGEDDINPAGVEDWTPGVRLSSMMAPCLARSADGALLAIGSGGSSRIRSALYQTLMHHLAGAMPIAGAVASPRVHVEAGFADFESHVPTSDRDWLTAQFPDHREWPDPNLYFGGAHAVVKTAKGGVEGAGDPRRSGVFLAF